MPNQPLRRSTRIAAKAAKKEEEVDDGDKSVKQYNTTTSSSSWRSSRSRSRTRSRTKRRCSLQSLEEKTTLPTRQSPRRAKSQQKTTTKKKTCKKAPLKSKKTTATSHVDSTSDEASSTMTPAAESDKYTSMATVKGVKFNLGRNSFAQFIKDDPPNIVEHLVDEIVAISEELFPVDDSDDQDDETTRWNEELLAEWETNFDDLDTRQVSRRTIRRVSMSS